MRWKSKRNLGVLRIKYSSSYMLCWMNVLSGFSAIIRTSYRWNTIICTFYTRPTTVFNFKLISLEHTPNTRTAMQVLDSDAIRTPYAEWKFRIDVIVSKVTSIATSYFSSRTENRNRSNRSFHLGRNVPLISVIQSHLLWFLPNAFRYISFVCEIHS